jgi:imidazolonepropionase
MTAGPHDTEVLVNMTLARFGEPDSFGIIRDAAVAVREGRILWIGSQNDLPEEFRSAARHDLCRRLVTPGLIECHTNLIDAGSLESEKQERLRMEATYEQQLARGDAIHATTRLTRAATEEELLESALSRARNFMAQGVTTLEIKSGYGLDLDTELKMLRVAKRLGQQLDLNVVSTLLAGHTYPLDIDHADFVEFVCQSLIPAALDANLADVVEVCCDDLVGLDLDDASTILESAYRRKVPTRMQADFLSDSAGAALAPSFYSKAAAHLLCIDELGVKALAAGGTTAVLLPIAVAELGLIGRPPVEVFRDAGVPIAISTGYNPSTAPIIDPLYAARLAVALFGLTPYEALAGLTRGAARALNLTDGQGDLRVGGVADFAVWDVTSPDELLSITNTSPCLMTLAGRRGALAKQIAGFQLALVPIVGSDQALVDHDDIGL